MGGKSWESARINTFVIWAYPLLWKMNLPEPQPIGVSEVMSTYHDSLPVGPCFF